MVFWIRISALLTGFFFGAAELQSGGYAGIISSLVNMEQGASFMLAFIGIGFLFAYAAFVTGVVTVPMLLDKKVDIVTGIATSFKAVWKNPVTMLIWATSIVALIVLSILPYYLGLIIGMPLVAHASWHAYSDLVTAEE